MSLRAVLQQQCVISAFQSVIEVIMVERKKDNGRDRLEDWNAIDLFQSTWQTDHSDNASVGNLPQRRRPSLYPFRCFVAE